MEYMSNTIFLVSQPRAGSTLVQHLLARHDEIYSEGETWIMLPLVGSFTDEVLVEAKYDGRLAASAVQEIWRMNNKTPIDIIRKLAYGFYNEVLQGVDENYYLDKTPRYYYILPKLREVFSESIILVLTRNPLAVLCSILDTWVGKKWYLIEQYRDDILVAPQKLADAIESHPNTLHFQYEKVTQSPSVLATVFDRLQLNHDTYLFDTELQTSVKTVKFGDAKFRKTTYVNPSRNNAWIETLENPQTWRMADDYLKYLGQSLVEKLGYSYSELETILEQHRPSSWKLRFTVSLQWLLTYKKNSNRFLDLRYNTLRIGTHVW